MTSAQSIEIFHIAFLGVLSRSVDQAHVVLKGGANLRYFFDSLRYSEDIDIDVSHIRDWQLEEKIDRVLKSQALALTLRSAGIVVGEFSKPKQTSTTQRWKIALAVAKKSEAVRTKIEFSHRDSDDSRFILEYIPERVVEPYALRPPSVQHYLAEAALEQKVSALAGRSETQARDVFDLALLLRGHPFDPGSTDSKILEIAKDRALELPFDAFRDQVLPFLEPAIVDQYDSVSAWEQMQTFVLEKLEGTP